MIASGRSYAVILSEIRQLETDRLEILGWIHENDEPISPWGVVVRIDHGLIAESHSYPSDTELLESLQVITEPTPDG